MLAVFPFSLFLYVFPFSLILAVFLFSLVLAVAPSVSSWPSLLQSYPGRLPLQHYPGRLSPQPPPGHFPPLPHRVVFLFIMTMFLFILSRVTTFLVSMVASLHQHHPDRTAVLYCIVLAVFLLTSILAVFTLFTILVVLVFSNVPCLFQCDHKNLAKCASPNF
jgi:uncharacterized membrane protein YhaH (DUF805 family)